MKFKIIITFIVFIAFGVMLFFCNKHFSKKDPQILHAFVEIEMNPPVVADMYRTINFTFSTNNELSIKFVINAEKYFHHIYENGDTYRFVYPRRFIENGETIILTNSQALSLVYRGGGKIICSYSHLSPELKVLLKNYNLPLEKSFYYSTYSDQRYSGKGMLRSKLMLIGKNSLSESELINISKYLLNQAEETQLVINEYKDYYEIYLPDSMTEFLPDF